MVVGGELVVAVLVGSGVISAAIGFAGHWLVVWALFATSTVLAVVWNVITVSLRQSIIPDGLLGRVNSVYRFFAWGKHSWKKSIT